MGIYYHIYQEHLCTSYEEKNKTTLPPPPTANNPPTGPVNITLAAVKAASANVAAACVACARDLQCSLSTDAGLTIIHYPFYSITDIQKETKMPKHDKKAYPTVKKSKKSTTPSGGNKTIYI